MSEYIYESHGEPLANEHGEIHLARRGEIVRCRDCKHHVDASPRSTRYRIKGPRCLLFSDNKVVRVKPDGYCAWASRKEDNDGR